MTTNILLQTTESLISAIQAEDVEAFRTLVQGITTAGLAAGDIQGCGSIVSYQGLGSQHYMLRQGSIPSITKILCDLRNSMKWSKFF